MSLGGFAQGLATAFQRAEDRYQDKKAREEARAEARLARAANQAFQEKMYTRRQKDDYMKDVMSYQAELKAIFGTDKKGLQMVAAVMPMGKYGVEMAKNYKNVANERGFSTPEFQDMFEVMYPDGLDSETFGDVDLSKIAQGMEQNRFAGPDDPRAKLSGIGFKFKELPKKPLDITEIGQGTTEASINMALAHEQNLQFKLDDAKERNLPTTSITKQLSQVRALKKLYEDRYEKEKIDALDLAKSKGSTKNLEEIKEQLRKGIKTDMEDFVLNAVDPAFKKEFGETIKINLEGDLTPKLFGQLNRAANRGLNKIRTMEGDPTYGKLTYIRIATEQFNSNIVERQLKVYNGLERKAMDLYYNPPQKGELQTGTSIADLYGGAVKTVATAKKPIVIIKKREVASDGTVTYGGKTIADYRKELMATLKVNEFYAIPAYKQDGTIDTGTKPIFRMHRGLFEDGKYNGTDPNAENYNPLGLAITKRPRDLPLPFVKE